MPACINLDTARKVFLATLGIYWRALMSVGLKMTSGETNVFIYIKSVDFTCLNCFSQTHVASAVGHELVDPKRRTRSVMEKGFM